MPSYLFLIISQNLTDFQNFCTGAFYGSLLWIGKNYPPHLRSVATLRRTTSLNVVILLSVDSQRKHFSLQRTFITNTS